MRARSLGTGAMGAVAPEQVAASVAASAKRRAWALDICPSCCVQLAAAHSSGLLNSVVASRGGLQGRVRVGSFGGNGAIQCC